MSKHNRIFTLTFLVMLCMSFCAFAQNNAMDIIGSRTLINAKGKQTTAEAALAGKKIIGLYFSAHWCGPCRAFTPQLVKFHEKCQRKKYPFEVVFVTSDNTEKDMLEYMKGEKMPWLALPFEDSEGIKALKALFNVNGIPTLVIIDNKGNVISPNGRFDVVALGEKAFKEWEKPDYVPMSYNDLQNKGNSRKGSKTNNNDEPNGKKKARKKNK